MQFDLNSVEFLYSTTAGNMICELNHALAPDSITVQLKHVQRFKGPHTFDVFPTESVDAMSITVHIDWINVCVPEKLLIEALSAMSSALQVKLAVVAPVIFRPGYLSVYLMVFRSIQSNRNDSNL